jgi:hypothetical protein
VPVDIRRFLRQFPALSGNPAAKKKRRAGKPEKFE